MEMSTGTQHGSEDALSFASVPAWCGDCFHVGSVGLFRVEEVRDMLTSGAGVGEVVLMTGVPITVALWVFVVRRLDG